MLPVPLDLREACTLDDLVDLPHDGHRYEVVDGSLVVTPPPVVHEDVARRLFLAPVRQVPDGLEAVIESALRLGTDPRITGATSSTNYRRGTLAAAPSSAVSRAGTRDR